MKAKPIRLQEWFDLYGKWVHFQLQPPKESHETTATSEDGTVEWKGTIHGLAEDVNYAADARLVDVRYDAPVPEDGEGIIVPELKGGRFTVTLQLSTAGGVLFPRAMPSED